MRVDTIHGHAGAVVGGAFAEASTHASSAQNHVTVLKLPGCLAVLIQLLNGAIKLVNDVLPPERLAVLL